MPPPIKATCPVLFKSNLSLRPISFSDFCEIKSAAANKLESNATVGIVAVAVSFATGGLYVPSLICFCNIFATFD